jgi:hypothetical protein
VDLRVVHLSGIWPQVYQSYLQVGMDGVGEGWCQTLFLVLTCRLRNQKQSLTPVEGQSLTPVEGHRGAPLCVHGLSRIVAIPLPRPSGRVMYSQGQDLVDGTGEDAAVARSAPSFRRL